MTASIDSPRPGQVKLLTEGVRLPLDPLPARVLAAAAELLSRAWADLVAQDDATVRKEDEPAINALMETRLNQLIEASPEWEILFSAVVRGRETVSYDGSHLEKRPDLSFLLANRNASFPLVVECKLIDADSDKTVSRYCSQGLARFLAGEYAWAVREALMLAYVRDGSAIADKLGPYLDSHRKKKDRFATEALPMHYGNPPHAHIAYSRHGRGFRYLERGLGEVPGPIVIWHLWLE